MLDALLEDVFLGLEDQGWTRIERGVVACVDIDEEYISHLGSELSLLVARGEEYLIFMAQTDSLEIAEERSKSVTAYLHLHNQKYPLYADLFEDKLRVSYYWLLPKQETSLEVLQNIAVMGANEVRLRLQKVQKDVASILESGKIPVESVQRESGWAAQLNGKPNN